MPNFVALDPQVETRDPEDGSQITPPGFCVFYLPFADDFRSVPDPPPTSEPNENRVNAAVRVIKKLKLKNYDVEQFEVIILNAKFRKYFKNS